MSVVPSSLALASIVDDSEIVASDHRNNYAAIQTAVNALISALSGGSSGQVLTASDASDVQWGAARTTYRKASAKAVNTTTAATDLLNGEITVAAGVLGTTGVLRLTAFGDWLQNSGGAAAPPRFQLLLGGSTLFDTGSPGTTCGSGTQRGGWRLVAEIANSGAANAQVASFRLDVSFGTGGSPGANVFTVGNGLYFTAYSGTATDAAVATATNVGAVNTASAAALVLNVINGSASASYETKLLGAIVEVL
jgi:hypothetical protein